jgi:hypothetical protein
MRGHNPVGVILSLAIAARGLRERGETCGQGIESAGRRRWRR